LGKDAVGYARSARHRNGGHMVDLAIMPDLNSVMGSLPLGIVHGSLACIEPVGHSLEALGGHLLVGIHLQVRAEMPVPFPVPQEKRLARTAVGSQEVRDEAANLPVFLLLVLRGE